MVDHWMNGLMDRLAKKLYGVSETAGEVSMYEMEIRRKGAFSCNSLISDQLIAV